MMKTSKLKKMIQKPFRFHHQDLHEELDELKNELKEIKGILQELRGRTDSKYQSKVMWLQQHDYDFDR